MATIQLENVPRQIGKVDLVRAIQNVLHHPPYHDGIGRLPNFAVELDHDPTEQFDHNGTGTLTIPDEVQAAIFISIYSDSDRPLLDTTTDWDDGSLSFTIGSDRPPEDLAAELRNTPFVDPQVAEGREARRAALSSIVGLRSVQFGWLCRDNRFSAEWQPSIRSIGNSPFHSLPSLRFKADSREIWISLGTTDDGTHEAMVITRFSRIEALIIDTTGPSTPGIIFTFLSPPSLELHETFEDILFGREYLRRNRLSSFGGFSSRITPYTLFAMQVTCASQAHLEDFRRMARAASLPRPNDAVPNPIVRRSLFSEQTLGRIERWLSQLPWSVAFQTLSILNSVSLDPIEIWNLQAQIGALLSDANFGVAKTGYVLRLFGDKLKDPSALISNENDIITCLEGVKKDLRRADLSYVGQSRNPGVFNCYHATVTPTRVLLEGPFMDQTNRILRQYPAHQEYFLRVSFTDEEILHFRWDRDVQGALFVKERVGGILEQGLDIVGRHFEFLAYSNSALREHAVWFCATFQEPDGGWVTAQSIRDGLGDFEYKGLDRQPAKLAARMSQAFTATEPSITLPLDGTTIPILDDIEVNDSVFTDGIGEISRALARRIVRSLEMSGRTKRYFVRPGAFQFRMGGCKGVLVVNPELKDNEIRLRKSQQKFISPLTDIEIAQVFYRAKPFYLNRFLIMILETLGVTASVFLRLQSEAIRDVETATESFEDCAAFLDTNGCGTSYRVASIFLHLSRLGLTLGGKGPMAINDGFLNRSIRFAKNHVLREMKHKARIPVKGSYTLVGVADFSGYLPPNTIFACIQLRDKKPFCIKGRVLISRSPQVHPGDVQYVEAIGEPPLDSPFKRERFTNCVVFSTQGTRSVPSMLAGGDLDGDEYNLILDTNLFPPSCYPPAEYPAVVPKTLSRPCVTKDITDWVTDYINSDILGLVCHQFLITADASPEMCRDPDCIKLAGLASQAVDFAKSGVPVERGALPKAPKVKPDWSVGEMTSARSLSMDVYESQTAIGQLYRHINLNRAHADVARQASREHGHEDHDDIPETSLMELEAVLSNLNLPSSQRSIQRHPISNAIRLSLEQDYIDISSSPSSTVVDVIRRCYPSYVAELRSICTHHTITKKPLTEEEVIMGTIASRTSQPKQRKEMIQQMRYQSDELVKRVQKDLKDADDSAESDLDAENDLSTLQMRLQIAWLGWRLAVERKKTFGAKSFGLIALTAIFDGMQAIDAWQSENDTRLLPEVLGTVQAPQTTFPSLSPLEAILESSAGEPVHVRLRAEAKAQGDAMARCFRESQEAFRSGDGARAKELSELGKLHRAQMDELNKQASEWIFIENNISRGRPSNEVDLHGLYVKEAIERADRAIVEAQERGDRELRFIVGRGMHSRDSVGKLRAAIEALMLKYRLACHTDPRNVGVLIVRLDENEGMELDDITKLCEDSQCPIM